mmetsp:Transcript_126982/g.317275  ORF Transcript_126982/g.317275 Transcript_126982/m.317275 type:complete len:509 (-) Transcript_126982:43-1569(-)|eukprot:CAMPEP_0115641132 /NCGR_PEP_ID=MMETSP0272-20121206/36153_1 /TAXON_ID=71861 /ORGANISM="Scrippsiella trochoidea, Strain CCMP3099" /LENGTH=508 /DNA_ID=CAMNT_0003078411 /DNA_START=67 /DNA_END=1593 /DNA_ORIENTATION=+
MAPTEAEEANTLARAAVEILPLFGTALQANSSKETTKEAAAELEKFRQLQNEAENFSQEKRGEDSLLRAMEAMRIGALRSKGQQDLTRARAKAVKVATKVAECFRQTGFSAGLGQATCALTALQLARGRPALAVELGSDAANIFRKAGDTLSEAVASGLVVDAHMAKAASLGVGKNFRQSHQLKMTAAEAQEDLSRARGKHFGDAVRAAEGTLDLLTQTNQKRKKADLLCQVSAMHIGAGTLEDAKECAMTARDLYHDLQDPAGEKAALLVEMDAHIADKDGFEALDVAKEVTKVFRKAKDKRGEAEGMLLQMRVLGMMQQVEEMTRLAKDARSLCQSVGDKKMEGQVVSALFNANIDKGDTEIALAQAQEAAEIFRRAGDKSGEANALHARGCIELEAFFKKLESDLAHFRKMGCMQQYYKEPDINAYEASLGLVKKAVDLFEAAEDAEGKAMAQQTLNASDQKAAMMNDPNETKQIWKDGKLVDVVKTWNPNRDAGSGQAPALADE